MPKINVYLPDALAERVRAADLPVSRICQVALSAALGSLDSQVIAGDADGLPEQFELELAPNNYVVMFLRAAEESARARGSALVESGDLLYGVLSEPDSLVYRVLERASGLSAERMRAMVRDRLSDEGQAGVVPALADDARQALSAAQDYAKRSGASILHGNHLAIGLMSDGGGVASTLMSELGVDRVVNQTVFDVIDESFMYSRATTPASPDTWTTSMLLELAARLERIEKAVTDD